MSSQESRAVDGTVIRRTRSVGDLPVVLSRSGTARISESGVVAAATRADGGAHSFDPLSSPSIIPPPDMPYSAGVASGTGTPRPLQPQGQQQLVADWLERIPAQPPAPAPNPAPTLPPLQHQSRFITSLAFFGLGRGASQARKNQMSLVWNLCWGFAQVVVIITLLSLTGKVWRSPMRPTMSEWAACDRPLGIWACIWVVRVILASGLAFWEYARIRETARLRAQAGDTSGENPVPATEAAAQPTAVPAPPAPNDPWVIPQPVPAAPGANPDPASENITLPYSHLYSRLTLFSSLLTLSWFLTAHILQYTSLNTCRYASPHLWWLTFGILCIMYLMILEVLLLGIIVLIIAPILFVFWNLFLLLIGRHPVQNPHMIKPDIAKLPKSVVDRIPLVMYIPPPPPAKVATSTENHNDSLETEKIQAVPVTHEYPPVHPPPPQPKKSRFRFFRKKSSKEKKGEGEDGSSPTDGAEAEKGKTQEETWEGHFEKGEYPFVVLEGNRAACAICLMDFEEPKRRIPLSTGGQQEMEENAGAQSSSSASTTPIAPEENQAEQQLRLEDAGEGAQPLRLLACGHVFHQTCLDPWLTDVSGRCPVCQRPVEVRELKKRKRGRR